MKKKSILFWGFVLIVVLIPFMLLALYNRPMGDDLWYTWMERKYGFAEGQKQWFITVNGRFSGNVIMFFNSFCKLSVSSYKIWPVAIIVSFIIAIYILLQSIVSHSFSKTIIFFISVLYTTVLYLNFPGCHEGTYWLASLIGYQVPLICFLLLIAFCIRLPHNPSPLYYILLCIMGVIIGGFNELIAFFSTIALLIISTFYWQYYKKIKWPFIATAIGYFFAVLIQVASIGNRYRATITFARHEWTLAKCLIIGSLQTSYHIIIRGILSPSYWIALLATFLLVYNAKKIIPKFTLPSKKTIIAFFIISLVAVFFAGNLLVYIENTVAPLRIMNISYFIFFISSIIFTVVFAVHLQTKPEPIALKGYLKYKVWFMMGLMVLMIFFPGNLKPVLATLLSGSAKKYSIEMDARFKTLSNCTEKKCVINCLQNQPLILCPVDICQSVSSLTYLEKVFNKQIIISPKKALK